MGLFLKILAALLSSPSQPTRSSRLEREMDARGKASQNSQSTSSQVFA